MRFEEFEIFLSYVAVKKEKKKRGKNTVSVFTKFPLFFSVFRFLDTTGGSAKVAFPPPKTVP